MWQGEIDDATIENIITECEYYEPKDASLGLDGRQDSEYRRSEVRWIDKNDSNSKFIADLIWYYVENANRNAFGFDISGIFDIQYTIYKAEDEGKYDWHHDTFWGNDGAYDRKLSVIFQLSDPSDYDGGQFEIDHQYAQPIGFNEKGSVIVFPSFIPHRVTEVTRGTRKSLVAWVEGPKFR